MKSIKTVCKKTKNLWVGKRLKDVYAHATRWQRVKYFVVWVIARHTLRYTVLASLLLSLIGAGFLYGKFGQTEVVFADSIKVVDSFPKKVEKLKDDVVNKIAQCESRNAPQDIAIVKYDNNSRGTLTGKNVASIGVMQWKVGTVQHFWKELYGEDISNYEATLIALDNDKAKKLAKEAIFGVKGAVFHWTCANDEIVAEVTLIKKLLN